jgi:hypothetical protein
MNINTGNLLKLASYLESLPKDYKHFEMEVYNNDEDQVDPIKGCGTVACAIGHTPYVKTIPLNIEDYLKTYINNKCYVDWSGMCEDSYGVEETSDAYEWCFSSSWAATDNTPQGAAKRIKAFVNSLGDSAKMGAIRDWNRYNLNYPDEDDIETYHM